MLAILLSPRTWVGFGAGLLAAGLWAVLIHGPAQHRAGSIEAAAKLDAATNRAIRELSDEADRAAFLRRQCIERGGMYDFAERVCVEREAE